MDQSAENDLKFMRKIFNAVLIPLFVVDDDVKMLLPNVTAIKALNLPEHDFHMKRGGELLHCVNSEEKGCGQGAFCKDCLIRNSVTQAISQEKNVLRQKVRLKLRKLTGTVQVNILVTVSPFEHDGTKLALVMLEDINELIKIGAFLSICSYCKKIRNAKGEWEHIEKYVADHIDVDFTHAFCPECSGKLLKGIQDEDSK